jgi:hypothetical protein|tara:strand:+ start:47 stop:376 length:330 start_codon:yes stop_codon:yes gene_type:complete
MRKIESEMNAAIKSKINFSKANTSVSYDADNNESNVYLHGNHIATAGSNFLHIFDGGWQSVTTKSRLNALINEFCDAFTCGVYQKDFTWYVTDRGTTHQFDSSKGYLFQ